MLLCLRRIKVNIKIYPPFITEMSQLGNSKLSPRLPLFFRNFLSRRFHFLSSPLSIFPPFYVSLFHSTVKSGSAVYAPLAVLGEYSHHAACGAQWGQKWHVWWSKTQPKYQIAYWTTQVMHLCKVVRISLDMRECLSYTLMASPVFTEVGLLYSY